MDLLRDNTYDIEIGNTIARRHNASFQQVLELSPKKCVDYDYSVMNLQMFLYIPLPDMTELCFVVPKSAPKSVFLVLLDPYDRFSWIAFGLTVIAISLVLFMYGESLRYTNFLLIALEMLMAVLNGPTHRLSGQFERFVIGLFMLLSIVVISGYQSLVISFMSSARYEPQLDTFNVINDTCLFMYDPQLSSLGYKFKNVHRTYEIFESTERMWSVKWCAMLTCTEAQYVMANVGDVDQLQTVDPDAIQLMDEEEWHAIKNQLKYFRYSKARIQSTTSLYRAAYDSPIRHHLAWYTQAFIEGRLEYFPVLKKSKPRAKEILEDTLDSISVQQMSMKDLMVAWILYSVGMAMSLLSFVLEQIVRCMRKIKQLIRSRNRNKRLVKKTWLVL
uniref:Ionotropic glutamate receptor C-terminal domain-containing protein n=1 Tax=Anopheles epiroticus TaxID=199890 RepID=A0A182PV76_9DIPT